MDSKTPSKDVIIQRLIERPDDEAAWRDLYIQFWPFVFGSMYRLLKGNVEQAKDLSQEIFIRLAKYQPFASVRSADKFQAYLGTACRNLAYDFFRQCKNEHIFTTSGIEFEQHVPAEASYSLQLREALQHISHHLNESERQLLDLMIGGRTAAEIAAELGINEATARVRTHRLRAKAKSLFDSA